MSTKALEYILSRPLLCTPEAAEVAASVATRETGDLPEMVSGRKGRPMDGTNKVEVRDGVAVVPVCGPISRYATMMTDLCGGTTVEHLARDITSARNDPGVRAILLNIDSPGGEANGIGELAAMIRAADKVKPVCGYVGGDGCSAAYWLAAGCGEVVAAETAQVGSIGCVMGTTVKSDKAGTKSYKFISSQSPLKHADPATEAGKESLQARCDALAGVFIDGVAALRGVTPEYVTEHFGRGGVMLGKAAVACGMADAVGDFESTLARMSRGERLVKSAPTNASPGAAGAKPKGTTMSDTLFSRLFGRVAKDHPEALAAALSAEGDGTDVNSVLASVARPAEPRVDAAAMRAEIEKEYAVKAEKDASDRHRATLAKFFAGQAETAFVDGVKAGHLAPTEKSSFAALYTELALLDHAGKLATADGGQVDRLPLLTAIVAKRPKAHLTGEVMTVSDPDALPDGTRTLPAVTESGAEAVSQTRLAAMLASLNDSPAARAAAGKLKTK